MGWYLLISVIYAAVFIAFMKSKEDDTEYVDSYGDWEMRYTLLCVIGAFFWPFVIPFIIVYKIALKILTKQKK